ncbi:MAG: OsmC family protein [Thermodesulfovibrionales bacterium]|nr:OsmC family protein [Thermodesulfovibrionales bacterium]
MSVKVKYIDGLQFVGESHSGHAIVMDGTPEVGGNDTGMRPMELLLVALGGCSGMDVASILKKKKEHVTSFEINLKGQKADEHPKKYTAIEIEFVVKGRGLKEESVKRAVELSMEKYCSVKATLEGTAKVNWSYRILEE